MGFAHDDRDGAFGARKWAALVDVITDDVIELDTQLTVTWASSGAETALGYSAGTLAGTQVKKLLHPDDFAKLHTQVNILDDGAGTRTCHVRVITAAGTETKVAAKLQVVRNDDGSTVGVVVGLGHMGEDAVVQKIQTAGSDMAEAQRVGHVGSWVYILGDERATWSDELYRIHGLDPAEVGPTWGENKALFDPEDWEKLVAAGETTARTGEPYLLVLHTVRPDGTRRWIQSRGEAVRDADGTIVGLRGVTADITDTVDVQTKLETSERRYRILADNSTDVVWERDTDGNLVWVSDTVQDVLGWTPEQLVGTPVSVLASGIELEYANKRLAELKAGKIIGPAQIQINTADGGVKWMSLQSRPLLGEDATFLGSVSGLKDIDATVRAEKNLTTVETRYRLVAENSTDAVFLVDTVGVVAWVSPSVKNVLGHDPHLLIGTNATDLVHPDDLEQLAAVRGAVTAGETSPTFELRMRTNTGTYVWVAGNTGPAKTEQGETVGRITTVRDVDEQVRTRKALNRSEETFRQAMDSAGQGMALVGLDGKFLLTNHALADLSGREETFFPTHTEDDIMCSDTHQQLYNQLVCGRNVDTHADIVKTVDGKTVHILHSISLVRAEHDTPLWFVSQYQNVEDITSAREEAETAQARYRLLAENATDVVWQESSDGTLVWVSESVNDVLGWEPDQLVGTPLNSLVHPDDVVETQRWKQVVLTEGALYEVECRMRTSDGEYCWMFLRGKQIQDSAGGIGLVVGMRTIDDMVHNRTELAYALEHDTLTGLALWPTLLKRLNNVRSGQGKTSPVAVLCIGIDALKPVNEALTHKAGDHILSHVAARLGSEMGALDMFGRGSGDEFVAVVTDREKLSQVSVVAEKLCQAVHGTVTIGAHHFWPTVSIGVTVGYDDSETLLRDAALAMRRAKETGRDRWMLFEHELAHEAQNRVKIEEGIREGLFRGQFQPWYQPVVNLIDRSIVGYEALIRWVGDDGTVTTPDKFLPIAEQSALITELDWAVLDQVLEQLGQMGERLHVAVNVSATTLAQQNYGQTVVEKLEQHNINPERLHLEFTETALLTLNDTVRTNMMTLAEAGTKWYVDDFGTGYSSIAHLRDLPVAGIKLDLSFTSGLGGDDQTCEQLAKALAGLAGGLSLDTIAEGVETSEQATVLRALNWTHGQGWLYGRAESSDKIVANVPDRRNG